MNTENSHIIKHIIWSNKDSREEIFTTIYQRNLWQSSESVSGKGSEINATQVIINTLPKTFEKYKIRTIVDAPCGDYNWFKKINYNFEKYYGIDIVESIIESNKNKYYSENTHFIQGDILTNIIPKVDLIFCRDCFIHLSNYEIIDCIKNFKSSGSKFLLTTNYENISKNNDLITGQFRKIDLTQSPFNLNTYIEKFADDLSENKFLYLWNLEEILL